jgi:hypothetical protein
MLQFCFVDDQSLGHDRVVSVTKDTTMSFLRSYAVSGVTGRSSNLHNPGA